MFECMGYYGSILINLAGYDIVGVTVKVPLEARPDPELIEHWLSYSSYIQCSAYKIMLVLDQKPRLVFRQGLEMVNATAGVDLESLWRGGLTCV